jgi:molybdopterin/thiamine biosynthesis adenylyltransferase
MSAAPGSAQRWSYETAFSRHRGLISPEEQERLRSSRVAVAGLGGAGGVDLVTLARLGIGRFTIADPDTFDVANTNRQYGAMSSTVGRNKAEVMAEIVRDINPEAEIRVITEAIDPDNVADFLDDADLLVDALDVFSFKARRLLHRHAVSLAMWVISGGPMGFSGVWIIFDPDGMSFDDYFDISDDMNELEQLVAFIVGMTPEATHAPYMDMSAVDLEAQTGPSSGLASQISAAAVACAAVKILLGRDGVEAAPHCHQFDPYAGRYAHGVLVGGNANPEQRNLRRRWVAMLTELAAASADTSSNPDL